MPYCPNCSWEVVPTAAACPNCSAVFSSGGWTPTPEPSVPVPRKVWTGRSMPPEPERELERFNVAVIWTLIVSPVLAMAGSLIGMGGALLLTAGVFYLCWQKAGRRPIHSRSPVAHAVGHTLVAIVNVVYGIAWLSTLSASGDAAAGGGYLLMFLYPVVALIGALTLRRG